MEARLSPGRTGPALRSIPAWPAALALMLAACNAPLPDRDPLGERFPTAEGRSLAGQPVELPASLLGAPAVLLVGYVQDAQFDADRWLYGLLQSGLPGSVRILEVPAIPGLFPRALAGRIDEGMRSGIPEEDWSSVVTVYGGRAGAIEAFTGSEEPRNVRVLLLDGEGRVLWFHDQGFSARALIELEAAAAGLGQGPARAPE